MFNSRRRGWMCQPNCRSPRVTPLDIDGASRSKPLLSCACLGDKIRAMSLSKQTRSTGTYSCTCADTIMSASVSRKANAHDDVAQSQAAVPPGIASLALTCSSCRFFLCTTQPSLQRPLEARRLSLSAHAMHIGYCTSLPLLPMLRFVFISSLSLPAACLVGVV